MKNIFKIALILILSLHVKDGKAQYGCLTPSLGVFDGNTFSPMSATIACTYTNLINISPTQWASGGNGTTPCLQIRFSTTNANTQTNNSLTISQGTNGVIQSLCNSAGCYSFIPSSSQYSFSLFFLDPTQAYGYNLCNINTAANFNYTVSSCYNSTPITSGVWNNSVAGGCQTISIPANSAIGLVGYTVSPAIPSTASISLGTGDLFLDTYQMAQGVYTITYSFNSQNACSIVATRTISITNPWNASWTALPNQCSNGTCVALNPQITGNTGGTFSGSGVSTNSFCPSSSGAGTFPVTYTVGITPQCGASVSHNILVNSTPTANAGSTQSITCANAATVLVGSGGGTYSWTGPVGGILSTNSNSATVGSTGNYTLTVTSNGCVSAPSTVNVVLNQTAPSGTTLTPNVITCASPNSNAAVTATAGMSYSWSGPGIVSGATTSSPVINAAGNYVATITNTVNGCSSTATVTATQNKTVTNTPSTTGVVNCTNTSISLSTPNLAGYSYTWTAPAGSSISGGVNNANTTASGPGNYSVTVYNSLNGCSSTSVVAATVNTTQAQPVATSGGTVTCSNTSIPLNSSTSGVTFTWSAPAGSSVTNANSANATANGGGTYTLTVTNTTNGCTNFSTAVVATQTAAPIAPNITNNPTLTCSNQTVTITSAPMSNVTFSWTGPGITGTSTLSSVNVNSPGVYSLAVTSSTNGCTSTSASTINVPQSSTTPTISALTQTAALVCGVTSVTLAGTSNPAGSTYSWTSSGGGFASTTNASSVAVTSSTLYTLTSAHPVTGCTAALVYTVVPSLNSPTVTLSSSSGTITCNNTQLTTTATSNPPTGVTYSWTGPGIVGTSTTAVLTSSLNGTYNLTVTNTGNNCTSIVAYVVSADNSPVSPNANASNTINCISTSANITTNPSPAGTFTYNWSNGATTSSVSVSPTTNTNYVVTVTNTNNGCTGSQTVNVTANTTPPSNVNTTASSVTLSCLNPNTVLTGSATGAASYSWIATGNNVIATTTTVNVNTPGTYSFVAVGANGCASAASAAQVSVVADVNAPAPVLSNSSPSIVCNNPAVNSTTVTGTNMTGASYSWSPASGVSSPTSNVVSFTAAGSYTCIVTGTNGCNSPTVVSVGNATSAPNVVAGTATAQALGCTNTVVTISPTFTDTNLSYNWTGAGIVGSSNSSSVQVNQAGTYTLVVTNTLTGCSNSVSPVTVPVTGSSVPPTATIVPSSTIGISCQPTSSTITLDAQASTAVTYTWSTAANTSSITTSTPGVYTLTVTDVNNGCVGTATIDVQNNATAPTLTSSASGSLPCGGGTTSLSAVSSNTNVSYTWMGNGIVSGSNTASPVIGQPGIYTVTALDAITGCSTFTTITVVQTTVSALAAASTTMGPAPLNVNFSNQSLGAATYSWSFGDGNSSITTAPSNSYLTPGTYTVVLVATNGGCSDSDTLLIKVQTALGAIPEVFTPNGDGKNDLFVIDGLDSYPNNNFQVFNRWGNPVYTAKPYKNDWDSKPNSQGSMGSGKLPSGTYFFILELGDSDNTIFKGFIQIQY
jgi:gliding motility-associated-like protein